MFSGLISHNNKVEGFYKVTDPGWPHMVDLLKDAGYYAGIRGKVTLPVLTNPMTGTRTLLLWRMVPRPTSKMPSLMANPPPVESQMPRSSKPFFLSVNISDPHKPFWSQVRGGGEDPYKPSRIFTADEVPVPGFLFEDEAVREELALYYSSVRRADDCLESSVAGSEEKRGVG